MSKNWKLKSEIPQDIAEKLKDHLPLIRQLLYNRGLIEKDQIEKFLTPKYEELHNPFLFKDMQKAVDRIWQAIDGNEQITIYGDYDADAVTANAVLQQTFRYLGVGVESYIPDRFTEGYGINLEALLKIKDRGSKIIITVDCGTNSIDAAEFCAKNKIDLIITDHHEVIGELPKAYAVINPKNPNDGYPYSEITGVGVAFKLACGILSQKLRIKDSALAKATADKKGLKIIAGYEKWLLDLVAIGTVADCHSLLGENRILVKYGLKVLAKSKWAGLRAISEIANLDLIAKPPDTYTLGFIVAPRLNAAGRLEHANIALNLLLETNTAAAQQKATDLEQINTRRQQMTERVSSEAKSAAELIQDRKILVVSGKDWPKGIVGLVAGKLAESFNKPTIVLSEEGDEATGSARSAGELDILESLKATSEYLVRFGGHAQAAGLTLKTENLEKFYQKLLEYAEQNLSNEGLGRELKLEAELGEQQLSIETHQLLESLEPFGVDNHKPKFLITSLKITTLRPVGAAKQHLQLKMQKGSRQIDGIAFNQGFLEKTLKLGDTIDAAAELIEDGWNGRRDVKLRIIDIKYSNV